MICARSMHACGELLNLSRKKCFSLAVMLYISESIIVQLLTVVAPTIEE